jgi:hypothetical protein
MGIGFAERSDPSGNPIESASAKVEQPLQVPPDGEGREENTGGCTVLGTCKSPMALFPWLGKAYRDGQGMLQHSIFFDV